MPHEELARPIVHLIDDDLAIRDSTELMLQIAGIDVRAYASGIEFLNDINPNEIRCLVIDVNMPGIAGIDLLDRLILQPELGRSSSFPMALSGSLLMLAAPA